MHPTTESLIDLIQDARKGEVVLPEFQRSFIWDRRAIEELLVSILNDYFIGAFLILNVLPDDHPFRARKIEGAEDPTIYAKKMVLDGQQRLTSAHYALYGPDVALKNTSHPYRFFLDIEAALEDRWEEAVYSEPTSWAKTNVYFTDPASQYDEDILSFAALRDWESWTAWYDGYRDKQREWGTFDAGRLEHLSALARRFLTFQVALIELKQSTPLLTVVEVFERINRTGSALSVFELVTARLWKYDVNLRDLWDRAREEHEWLGRLAADKSEAYPKFALQLLALLRGKECKRKDLILLDGEGFLEDWTTATSYLNRALERMHSTSAGGYGVIPAAGIPYSTMATPLAALIHFVETGEAGNPEALKKLHYWYWSSVFTERYGGSTDTLSQRDYTQVARWIRDSKQVPSAVLTHEQQLQRDLRDVVRAGAVYRGVQCLIALQGARDFYAADTIELHDLDDHHIFPQAFLKAEGYEQHERNTILNRTLIVRDTNQRIIRAKQPSVYLAEMEELHGEKRVREILETHFIDAAGVDAMRADDYESFLAAREGALRAEIISRCVYSSIGLVPESESRRGIQPGQESRRITRLEVALRDLVHEILEEDAGEDYWRHVIPGDIQSNVKGRVKAEAKKTPQLKERRLTGRELLDFCDFSDYERILFQKNCWPLFESVFSERGEAARHLMAVRRFRNTVKHGRNVDQVERLGGEAGILWLERALDIKEFADDIGAEDQPTTEDCVRVLVRRPISNGQKQLYSALLKAGEGGLTTDELVDEMGRRDRKDLSGVLGALGNRINGTPGFGAKNHPGIEMIMTILPEGGGLWRYRLRPVMVEALQEASPEWLPVIPGASRSPDAPSEASNELTPTKQLQQDYWAAFLDHVESVGAGFTPPKSAPGRHWIDIGVGRTGYQLRAIASAYNNQKDTYDIGELRAEFIFYNDDAMAHFDRLREDGSSLTDEVSEALEWDDSAVKSRKCFLVTDADLGDREHWPTQHEWLRERLNRLHDAFTSRLL